MAAQQLLESTSLNDIIRTPQSVVTLRDTATVEQALRVRAEMKRERAHERVGAWSAAKRPPPLLAALSCYTHCAHNNTRIPPSTQPPKQVLASKRILSAPVKLSAAPGAAAGAASAPPPQPDGRGATIFGFVDVRDIVASFFRAELAGADIKSMKMLQRMRLLEEKGQAFAMRAVRDLPVVGGDGDFYHISAAGGAPLQDVVVHGLLAPPSGGGGAAGGDVEMAEAGGGGGGGGDAAGLQRQGSARLSPAARPVSK